MANRASGASAGPEALAISQSRSQPASAASCETSCDLAGEHLQEGGLGDDLDVRPGGVQLLGLDLLGALLAVAVQRRPLVADDQVVQLVRHARGHRAARLAGLVLGLLALHGRQLAGEQERGPAQVDLRRLGGRGRAADAAASLGAKSAGTKPLIIVSTAKS